MDNAEMQVTYTLTTGDIRALDAFAARKTRVWPRAAALMVLLIVVLSLVTLLSTPGIPKDAAHMLAYFVSMLREMIPTLLFGAVAIFLIREYRYRTAGRLFPGIFDPRTVSLAPDAFVSRDFLGEFRHYWSKVDCLAEDRDHIFVFHPVRKLVIPKRAFPTPGEAELFYRTAVQLRTGTRNPAPVNPW